MDSSSVVDTYFSFINTIYYLVRGTWHRNNGCSQVNDKLLAFVMTILIEFQFWLMRQRTYFIQRREIIHSKNVQCTMRYETIGGRRSSWICEKCKENCKPSTDSVDLVGIVIASKNVIECFRCAFILVEITHEI